MTTGPARRCATFATDLRQAEALAIGDAVSKITTAANKEWRAAAWWLERTYPERYGARRTIRAEAVGPNAPLTLAGHEALMGLTDDDDDDVSCAGAQSPRGRA